MFVPHGRCHRLHGFLRTFPRFGDLRLSHCNGRRAASAQMGLWILAVPGTLQYPAGTRRCRRGLPFPFTACRSHRSGLVLLGQIRWGAYQMDESRYPDPKAIIKAVHDLNMHYMISVWPNPSGSAAEALHKINGFVGGGKSGVYDATNPEARKVRWNLLNDAFFSIGTDAWWQDAAEPLDDGNGLNNKTVFLGSGNRLHNVFPLFHSECIYEGQRAANPEKRVCNLTRSAYPGQQRYATVVWSGDVAGNWETFRRQIPAGLNICLAGIPYWTTDCGGFFRPSHQFESKDYNELQARWFEWSTFCPILRIHGYMTKTEIWNWFLETQKILAAYDRLRYRMLPYNYSSAWQVTSAASTIMRALPMDFPNDPAACQSAMSIASVHRSWLLP